MADWRKKFSLLSLSNDGIATKSSQEQERCEASVAKLFKSYRDSAEAEQIYLFREVHITYLESGIRKLPYHFECLDASRPWLCYWILHSLSLLKHEISQDLTRDVIDFLRRCQSPHGGFGGGPGQLPHLAPTYAAVLALCILGTKEAYDVIDRASLQLFLSQMHQSDGSFIMHFDGEVDVRGVYCALVPAILTNTLTDDMISSTADWVASCQTYEGSFSAVPGTEGHGGYAFCAFASLLLLKEQNLCDIHQLLKWACHRQMSIEGGFQGRTNKLVDGCYSFWVGGLFPLIYMSLKHSGDKGLQDNLWHFHQESLQEYILYCCQYPRGGLMDKPGKGRDYYHTCYCLSGLSVSQYCFGGKETINITDNKKDLLIPTHPLFNIPVDKVDQAMEHFTQAPKISILQQTERKT